MRGKFTSYLTSRRTKKLSLIIIVSRLRFNRYSLYSYELNLDFSSYFNLEKSKRVLLTITNPALCNGKHIYQAVII